jgi:hypothetical protein
MALEFAVSSTGKYSRYRVVATGVYEIWRARVSPNSWMTFEIACGPSP